MEQLFIFLRWLAGVGAGVFASWILDQWDEFDSLDKEMKRVISIATTGVVGAGAVAIGVLISAIAGTVEMPVDFGAWFVILANAATAAILAGQVRHTATMFKKT